MSLLFVLAAEPRPPAPPANEVSIELLEYLGGIDSAPDWVRDDTSTAPATDVAAPPPPRTPEQRR